MGCVMARVKLTNDGAQRGPIRAGVLTRTVPLGYHYGDFCSIFLLWFFLFKLFFRELKGYLTNLVRLVRGSEANIQPP